MEDRMFSALLSLKNLNEVNRFAVFCFAVSSNETCSENLMKAHPAEIRVNMDNPNFMPGDS